MFLKYSRQFFRNLIRNGLWPTSIYNLGVGVALISTSLAADWRLVKPLNRRLWTLADWLHMGKGDSQQLSYIV